MSTKTKEVPKGDLAGLKRHWKADLLSGFLVFLIALPLCLGISLASGFPASAGIITAIVGGLMCGFISNSELTIKGPAAGLIVIVLGCVMEFGFTGGKDPAADLEAYKLALGVGVAAGVIQILIGLLRGGILSEFFPTETVHGLLAAIGVIIFLKQFPVMLGLGSAGTPFELLTDIPDFVQNMNPILGGIGLGSLAILFLHRFLPKKIGAIPGPLMVLIISVPVGMAFGVHEAQSYTFGDNEYLLGPAFLVNVPLNLADAIVFPDFSGVTTSTGIKYIVLFSVIGSLESLLSAKAIDEIDPWRRRTNHDRDLTAVGIGNTAAAFIGGLPMISEIVRSRANIDNGARTRFANLFHGAFLLVLVAAVPGLINRIPLSALAALLVFVGLRLASPAEFRHMFKLGYGSFIVFCSTIVAVLATDLLVGIGIGVVVQFIVHLASGVPAKSMFKLSTKVDGEDDVTITVQGAAVFSTWIPLRKKLVNVVGKKRVVLDMSETKLVDRTVIASIGDLMDDFEDAGTELEIKMPPHQASQMPKHVTHE